MEQVWLHLVEQFFRRFKCEKDSNDGQQTLKAV
jgi:hypothetical protein